MSKKRKSFIVHFDSLNVLDDLTNEQAGLLFKAIRGYQLGDELELDALTKIAFSPFKNQFIRDNDKYENLCEKNRLIAINRYATKSTTGTSGNQSLPDATKSTDNDSKSKSDSKSDSDSDSDSKNIKDMCVSSLELEDKKTSLAMREDGFNCWWSNYPKKTAKPDAEKAFKAKVKTMNDNIFIEFIDFISSDSSGRYKETEKQFIPAPAKYIRQELYNDE